LPQDDPRRRRPNIDRAIELLGWLPRTSLEAGLERTIAWFKEEDFAAPLIATAAE
jgi:UDP-glucuronate decarboxylase